MFRKIWWRFRAVRSDEGFAVNFIGLRDGIEYIEASQVFRLEVERGTGGIDWIVYSKSLKRQVPAEQTEAIPEETRRRICDRVRSALSFLKVNFAMD
jgi:hypothetical protein